LATAGITSVLVRIVSRTDTSSTGSVTAGSGHPLFTSELDHLWPVICTGPPAPTMRRWVSAPMSARNAAAAGLAATLLIVTLSWLRELGAGAAPM
jgi:hypothetical protein